MRNGVVYLIEVPLELQEQTFQEFADFNRKFINNPVAVLNIQFDLIHIKDDLFILTCEHNLLFNFGFCFKIVLQWLFYKKLKGVKFKKLDNKFWVCEVLKCRKAKY